MTAIFTALMIVLQAAAPAQSGMEIRTVAEGVYAALQPSQRRFDDCNSAIVVFDDGVLVVDSQISPLAAREVIREIRALTTKPVRWVVNTHWHGDHVQGNQAYREAFPEVEFVAHENTREDIRERAAPGHAEELRDIPGWIERAEQALRTGTANGQSLTEQQTAALQGRLERRRAYLNSVRAVTEFVLPTLTVRDELMLHRGGREVRVTHYRGHTEGDLAVYLPYQKVLITGDLLDDLPYAGHGSPAALVETLRSLERLDFDVIIPGHGRLREGRDHLQQVIGLFTAIVEQASAAAQEGVSLESAQQRLDVGAFRPHFVTDDASERVWDFFVQEAAARAYQESKEGRVP